MLSNRQYEEADAAHNDSLAAFAALNQKGDRQRFIEGISEEQFEALTDLLFDLKDMSETTRLALASECPGISNNINLIENIIDEVIEK